MYNFSDSYSIDLEWVLLFFSVLTSLGNHPGGAFNIQHIFLEGSTMVKVFTLLLALLIALSFGGLTFAKSLGSSSDQITIQVPQGDDKDDTKDGEKGDAPKADDDKDKGDEDKDKDK
jgi:hypothetical protein